MPSRSFCWNSAPQIFHRAYGHAVRRQQREHSIGMAAVHRQAARCSHLCARPESCARRSISVRVEQRLTRLRLGRRSPTAARHPSRRILSIRKPGFTSSTFIRLRPRSPAPTTSTSVIAICAATIAAADALARHASRPARVAPSIEAPRVKSPPVARTAVNAPRPVGDATDDEAGRTPSTGTLMRDALEPRQVRRRQRHEPGARPRTRRSRRGTPPISTSRNASVRN